MEKGITTHQKRCSPVTKTNALVNFRKSCSLLLVWLASLEVSIEAEPKKGFFRQNHWRFGRKAKFLTVFVIVAVMLISVFAFLPKQGVTKGNVIPPSGNSTATPSPTAKPPSKSKGLVSINSTHTFTEIGSDSPSTYVRPPGLIQSDTNITSDIWLQVASYAWDYFQPGIGVDSNTGLPYALGTSFTGFTDWDLGCYIQALIDAQNLTLIGPNDLWGFNERVNMVLTFLENRTLNPNTDYPYQFYDATNGSAYNMPQESYVDVTDTGRLMVALYTLESYNSSFKQQIDYIVYNKCNYAALVPSIEQDSLTSTDLYSYFVYSGFASFFPALSNAPNEVLTNILKANVTYSPYGNVSLPDASISGDPLLMSIFELNNNDSRLMALSQEVYLASEAYYNATGNFAAFSEGNGYNGTFIDEWVVVPNGDTWVITTPGVSGYLSVDPVIYTKIAFSFLALYNTTDARNMIIYLEQNLPLPVTGYADGANNSGFAISGIGSNTNQLILDAALYALQNNSTA